MMTTNPQELDAATARQLLAAQAMSAMQTVCSAASQALALAQTFAPPALRPNKPRVRLRPGESYEQAVARTDSAAQAQPAKNPRKKRTAAHYVDRFEDIIEKRLLAGDRQKDIARDLGVSASVLSRKAMEVQSKLLAGGVKAKVARHPSPEKKPD